jgi:hypothetical protein
MAYKGETWQQANEQNQKLCGSGMACNNFNAANWMCLYLFQTRGMTNLGCENPKIVGHAQGASQICPLTYARCP